MALKFVRNVGPAAKLYRDDITGLATIHDGTSGCGISVHSNIDRNGSVKGMKHLGYWKKNARKIRCGGFIYNIDSFTLSWPDESSGLPYEYEQIVAKECNCQGCLERRSKVLS